MNCIPVTDAHVDFGDKLHIYSYTSISCGSIPFALKLDWIAEGGEGVNPGQKRTDFLVGGMVPSRGEPPPDLSAQSLTGFAEDWVSVWGDRYYYLPRIPWV